MPVPLASLSPQQLFIALAKACEKDFPKDNLQLLFEGREE
jgi:hypothetical protein